MAYQIRHPTTYAPPDPSNLTNGLAAQRLAARIRSNEDKIQAALQARLRAAANHREVVQDAATLAEQHGRRARHQSARRSDGGNHTVPSISQNQPSSQRQQKPQKVRFGSTPSERDIAKHRPHASKRHVSGRSEPVEPKPQATPGPAQNPRSWTAKLKALTGASQNGKARRTETSTSTFHERHRHNHRQVETPRKQPNPTPVPAANVAGHRAPSSPPPYRNSHNYNPPSAPQSALLLQHQSHQTATTRMDVYLAPGPSDWYILDAQHGGFPLPALSSTHQPHPHPQPQPQPPWPGAAPQLAPNAAVPQAPPTQYAAAAADAPPTRQGGKTRQPVWDEGLQSVRWEWM